MWKLIKTFLLSIIVVSTTFGQSQIKSTKKLDLPWIKFNWQGDSLARRYFDKAAIVIPLKIDNLAYDFNAQLDLGAVETMFYGKSIKAYLEMFPLLKQKLDTTQKPIIIQGRESYSFQNINLKLDTVLFSNLKVVNLSNFGDSISIDSAKTISSKHIGTIAPDLFKNRILVIDYPNERMCVLDSLPKSIQQKADFVDIKIRKGRIKIPFTVNGKVQYVMFDTGSSIFSILTSEENSIFFAETEKPIIDSIVGEQWGQKITIYGKKISAEIKLGKHKMPFDKVYFLTDKGQKTFEDEENIIGLTGNAYFLNNTIIIDYKNNRFGVL